MASGIYQIRNLINGKRYIGSAVNFGKRWRNHKCLLRTGAHKNAHLQAAWNKHGEGSFVFEVLLECEVEELIEYEQLCLEEECPEYNICKVAGSSLGRMHTEETKKKLSARKVSEEARKKISEANKGHVAWNKGQKTSEEVKQKLSDAARNRSAETKRKLSEGRKGKPHTEETRKKLSDFQKNRPRTPLSEETRRKISESRKGQAPWNKGRKAADPM